MKALINFLVGGLAVIITSYVLAGVSVDNFFTAFLVAVILAIINFLVKPIVLLLTLPLNILTLGLFTFVINALMILLAAVIIPGFVVSGFWWALAFSLILSLVYLVLHSIIKK